MYKTVKALVLREAKYKEADKILTVLTEGDGKMTVKARGALRKGCRFSAASQILAYSEMILFGSGGKWSINEAETLEQFLPLRSDIGRLSLGSYFAEMLEAVSDEDSPNPGLLQLGLNSLYALSRELYAPRHIKSVFELRLMCLSGFEPMLWACPACGTAEPQDPLFSLNGGTVHCRSCPPGSVGISVPMEKKTLEAMRFVVNAEPKRIFSFRIPTDTEKQLSDICEAYAAAQLERGFSALDYWKRIRIQHEEFK